MKLVVTEPAVMAAEVRARLASLGDAVFGPFSDAAMIRELFDAEVLMVRLGRRIDAALLAEAPRLRYVVTATTGLDHIDLAAAAAAGVRVVSLRDCPDAITDVSATAEHTLGLLLALVRRTPSAHAHVLGGNWDRDRFWGTQLRGKRVGVIGYGRIGAHFGAYCKALGMEVVACDRDPQRIPSGIERASLADLVIMSDVVSIHATADLENRHLLNSNLIAGMKSGAILLNTARGSLIDEAAAASALVTGGLAGIAVDVIDGEEHGRQATSPLVKAARDGHNVLVTPHIGGATHEAIARAEGAVVEVLTRLLAAGATSQ